jgi:hypothetical protein
MAREGTRSQTGNARPRVFQTVDTAPTITRKPAAAAKPAAAKPKAAKPAGVTKKTTAKKPGPVAKVRESDAQGREGHDADENTGQGCYQEGRAEDQGMFCARISDRDLC